MKVPTRPVLAIGLGFLGATFAGCSAGEGAAGVVQRDSMGIRIVENPTPDEQSLPRWVLSPEPVTRVGGARAAEGHDLFRVTGALVREDGSVVVLSSGTADVRAFSPDGTLEWTYGRSGDGPGEFAYPIDLFLLAVDSVGVWDTGHARATVLAPDGMFARDVTAPAAFPAGLRSRLVGLAPDGGLLVQALRTERAAGSGWSDVPFTLYLLEADGSAAELGDFPWETVKLFQEVGLVTGRRFGGHGVAYASAEGFGVARGNDCEWESRDWSGSLRTIIRWDCGDRQVQSSDIEAYRSEQLAAASAEGVQRVRRELDVIPYAETFPPYARILADAEGRIWVQPFRRPGAGAIDQWMVFSSEGRMVAMADIPSERVLSISHDRLVTNVSDDLGVEEVRVYRIERE